MTISVGGEIGEVGTPELDGRRAAGLSRRLPSRARRPRTWRHRHQQGQRPDRHEPRRGAAARRRRRRGQARLRRAPRARRRGPRRTAWPARSSTAPRPCPDELFHRFPAVETAEIHLATGFQNALYEHPAFPDDAPSRDRGVVLRERRRRAQGRPDRPAVRVHDPQEGDRPVQARAVGPRDQGRDPRRPAAQVRVPVHGARRQRLARDGRPPTSGRSRSTGRCPTPCARSSRLASPAPERRSGRYRRLPWRATRGRQSPRS